MKIKIENVGALKSADFFQNRLTIFCGDNNSGKTYLSYTFYGLLEFIKNNAAVDIDKAAVRELRDNGVTRIDLEKYLSQIPDAIAASGKEFQNSDVLSDFFSGPSLLFKDASIDVALEVKPRICSDSAVEDNFYFTATKLEGENFIDVTLRKDSVPHISSHYANILLGRFVCKLGTKDAIRRPFSITSERTGVALFYKDLDLNRNQIIEYISRNKDVKPYELIAKMTSTYANPIKRNIDFVRDSENIKNKSSFLSDSPEGQSFLEDWRKVVGGSFKFSGNSGSFYPVGQDIEIPMSITSSAVKALFLLDTYLNHNVQKGDILFVDEPELNLHPSRQIMVARLLARLVNFGVDVVITTHSDYIVREIGALIMLQANESNQNEIAGQFGIHKGSLLKAEDVSAYYIDGAGVLKQMKVGDEGVEAGIFDVAISTQSEYVDAIYFNRDK